MNFRKPSAFTKLLTVLLSTVAPAVRAEAQTSGKVGAVNPDATGTSGTATRTLVVGSGVVHKERIQTSTAGSTQILFPDQSTLNVGRNSSIVIDEYVYNPSAGTGTMVATLGKGVMRFVGGQISHTKGVTVNTAVATLGIRGGVGTIVYPIPADLAASDPNLANARGQLVICHVGTLTLRNNAGQVTLRPGFAVWVNGPNSPISEPFRVSELVLQKIVAALTSAPGQTGGGPGVNVQPFVIRDGIGTVILNDPAKPPGTDPLGYTSIFGGGNDVVRSKSQSNQINNTAPPPYGAQ